MQMHCKSYLRDSQKGKRGVRKSRAISIGIAVLLGLSARFVLPSAHQGFAEPLKQSDQHRQSPEQPQGQVSATLMLDVRPQADLALLKARYKRPEAIPFPADNPHSQPRELLGRTRMALR